MPDNQPEAPPPITPPPPTFTGPAYAPPPPADPDKSARTWNMLCHLSALAAYIGIPFGNIIGPLVIWQVKKNEFPSVDIHGKAALNFQITISIALAVAVAATLMGVFFCIGWLLVPVPVLIGLAGTVFAIIAGIKANNGENYQYPWSIEFVK